VKEGMQGNPFHGLSFGFPTVLLEAFYLSLAIRGWEDDPIEQDQRQCEIFEVEMEPDRTDAPAGSNPTLKHGSKRMPRKVTN